jgi:hypothetical protein
MRWFVGETLNGLLLDAPANVLCCRQRHGQSPNRVDTHSRYYKKKPQIKAKEEAELKVPV